MNMGKKKIRVAFDDSVVTVHPQNEFLLALSKEYEPIIDKENPELVIYGNFGWKHLLRPNAVKLFASMECVAPDFNACDFAVSNSHIDFDGRNLWLPPCFSQHLYAEQPELPPVDAAMAKRRFCLFLYSQRQKGEGSRLRAEFCEQLMQYAHVDCPGRVLHNMDAPELAQRFAGDWNQSKINFLSRYKFTIAFENSNSRGYITEKLTDCFIAGTVPIYWGSEGDLSPFPKEAVICANDYPSTEALIARIKEVNENDDEYLRILAANPLRHGMQLSRREEFDAFVLRAANMATRPESCDPVAHSDVALMRVIARNPLVRFILLSQMALRFIWLKCRLRFARGAAYNTLYDRAWHTKWLGILLVQSFKRL